MHIMQLLSSDFLKPWPGLGPEETEESKVLLADEESMLTNSCRIFIVITRQSIIMIVETTWQAEMPP